MKFKVYVSGPMTGLPNDGRDAMIAEEAVIRKYFDGHEVEIVNPARMPDIEYGCGCPHETESAEKELVCDHCGYRYPFIDYRATIIRSMLVCRQCEVLWLMDGWDKSLGCIMETESWRSSHPGMWRVGPHDVDWINDRRIANGILWSRKGVDLKLPRQALICLLDSMEAKP